MHAVLPTHTNQIEPQNKQVMFVYVCTYDTQRLIEHSSAFHIIIIITASISITVSLHTNENLRLSNYTTTFTSKIKKHNTAQHQFFDGSGV